MRQSTYKNKILLPKFFPESYRDTETEEYRYRPTYLQDQMKRFHFVCKILNDGTPQKPIEGVGAFVPRNWKEQRSWEQVVQKPVEKKRRVFKKLFSNNGSHKNQAKPVIFSVNPDDESSRAFVEENAILLGNHKQRTEAVISVPKVEQVIAPEESFEKDHDSKELLFSKQQDLEGDLDSPCNTSRKRARYRKWLTFIIKASDF